MQRYYVCGVDVSNVQTLPTLTIGEICTIIKARQQSLTLANQELWDIHGIAVGETAYLPSIGWVIRLADDESSYEDAACERDFWFEPDF
jgi:hypothetical protein